MTHTNTHTNTHRTHRQAMEAECSKDVQEEADTLLTREVGVKEAASGEVVRREAASEEVVSEEMARRDGVGREALR